MELTNKLVHSAVTASNKLGIIFNAKFPKDQTPSIKCAYKWKECILIVVRTYTDYLFPIEKENCSLFRAVQLPFYLLNFHLHDRGRLILDNELLSYLLK